MIIHLCDRIVTPNPAAGMLDWVEVVEMLR